MTIRFNKYQVTDNDFAMRTGIAGKMLSCGTGVTVPAIVSVLSGHSDTNIVPVNTGAQGAVCWVLGAGCWVKNKNTL